MDGMLIGPAGNCEDFYAAGNKSSLNAPKWVMEHGLTAYEYQCGKGVKISDEAAEKIGEEAKKYGIALSVHAPYYISISSEYEEKREKSILYILQTLQAAKSMGAARIVVHSGSCAKITRRTAMDYARDTLTKALRAAEEEGFGDILICPETMGKINQLGSVEEVVEMCKISERLMPAIDFGHVNCRTLGGLKTKEDFERIFNTIYKHLGEYRGKHFHAHYSRIEYTTSGEKKHHRFDETEFEPEFDPIAEIAAERGLAPTVICESRGSQTRDAAEMMRIYRRKSDAAKA